MAAGFGRGAVFVSAVLLSLLLAASAGVGTGAMRAGSGGACGGSGDVTGAGGGFSAGGSGLRRRAEGLAFGTTGFGVGVSARPFGGDGGAWVTRAANSCGCAPVPERKYSQVPMTATHTAAAIPKSGIGWNHRRRAEIGIGMRAAGETGTSCARNTMLRQRAHSARCARHWARSCSGNTPSTKALSESASRCSCSLMFDWGPY
jgi:hypothetical protein